MSVKKFIEIVFYTILSLVICLYFGIVFLLPQIINNKTTINKLQSLIYDKTGIETNIAGLKLNVSPQLIFILSVDGINVKYNNLPVADIKKINEAIGWKPEVTAIDGITEMLNWLESE